MQPTKQQQLILDHDGCAVVIAAPGSGKTFVISNMIKQKLSKLSEHQGIIAISYTNKASNELKHRSLSNGENPRFSFFGTIDRFTISDVIIPFGKHVFGIPASSFRTVKLNELSVEDVEEIKRLMIDRKVFNQMIEKLGRLFMNGIILIEYVGLLANYIFSVSQACKAYLKARYTHIYIDEYQDSGAEQHQLFLSIKNLGIKAIAVGDLNQSIYAFSNKDAKYLKELTKNVDFKYFKLDKNHRCAAGIINYSNYLLNPKTELIADEDRPIIFTMIDGGNEEIAAWIDKFIEKLKEGFHITDNNKIAILTRYGRTAVAIDKTLTTPHRYSESNELDKSMNVWASIFSSLLSFLFDHNYRFIDVVEQVTEYNHLSKVELKRLNQLKKSIEAFRGRPLKELTALKETFCEVAKIIALNSVHQDSVLLLNEVLNTPEMLEHYYPTATNEIHILTLHKSKGLEYDLIIHLDLHEWALPAKRPGPGNDFNNPVFENYQQDLNLHYVGVTRARKACVLISSTKRVNNTAQVKKGSPSEFLSLNGIEKLRYSKKKEEGNAKNSS
ncbi:DNA helicase-2 / ATP-dependent DNA helicase PcrA [Chitinophaga sp. YR573]|uniref:UvrD-helicase domain-containing protein n=1 Tax=Chitinophaga sp. YR573 TaxID=1881040 RepID=UPI0008B51BB9|nr:ATP-dependent helicase [Chitinophaga sp. YR573]SEW35168.1 DNA helicase-2 / ATP-dependent DNA helicase PcrA [Chitinophaga sp. YR573]